ncbi:MAG: multiheme c-type cytochrome [Alphaproteobacteria bacterium]
MRVLSALFAAFALLTQSAAFGDSRLNGEAADVGAALAPASTGPVAQSSGAKSPQPARSNLAQGAPASSSGNVLGGGSLLQGAPAGSGSAPAAQPPSQGGSAPSSGTTTAPAAPATGGQGVLGGGLLQSSPQGSGTIFTGAPPAAAPPAAAPPAKEGTGSEGKAAEAGDAAHSELLAQGAFPSAFQCGECHPRQFREWSVSQHAYAQISPIFNAFQHTVNKFFNGSNGDFCFRCHTQAGAELGESPYLPNEQRHQISREGITCISCHRIEKTYNKVSGRVAVRQGPITDPVYGPTGDAELKRVLADTKDYQVVADPDKPGRKIHGDIVKFAPIRTSTFCGSCHDVTLNNGFRLEEAFSEYRTSPAAARGLICQDCHMGKTQGQADGYDTGPAAVIEGVPTQPRRATSHIFSGPDYSVVAPAIFPHNKAAQQMASYSEWAQFDYKAGWGTDTFEHNIPAGYKFPDRWRSVDDRYDARAIIVDQLKLLDFAKEKRYEVLRNGYQLGQILADPADSDGIRFKVEVKNGTDGHNVPTGFTEERLVWLDVTVSDPAGKVVFRSGDRDPNGDVRDSHSSHVRAGNVSLDGQLFSIQAIVLVRNLRGSEQPAVIPIPFPLTALPYIRPATSSAILSGMPQAARNQKRNIDPHGQRWASYHVSGSALTGKGTYHVNVRLRSQAVPVNLVTDSQEVGFDYNMSTKAVVDNLIESSMLLWDRDITVDVR